MLASQGSASVPNFKKDQYVGNHLQCPICRSVSVRTMKTQTQSPKEDPTLQMIRRRRACLKCKHRWTTYEGHQRVWQLVISALERQPAEVGAGRASEEGRQEREGVFRETSYNRHKTVSNVDWSSVGRDRKN